MARCTARRWWEAAGTVGEFHAGCGTIYRISTAGEEKVLYRFAGGSDGDAPVAGLVNVNGTLYGTTENGGGSNKGTFLSIAPASKDYSLLYVFTGHYPNGANPKATLLDFGGTLYGTTHAGLGKNRGTVFSITTAGTEQSLHVFKGEPDGAFPFAALVNVSGSLYGTTYEGGIGYGTVFRITPPDRKLTVIYKFGGGADGGSPIGGLMNINGTLYGTTEVGGHSGCVRFNDGCGTIYSMSTTGVKNVLYRFKGPPDLEVCPSPISLTSTVRFTARRTTAVPKARERSLRSRHRARAAGLPGTLRRSGRCGTCAPRSPFRQVVKFRRACLVVAVAVLGGR